MILRAEDLRLFVFSYVFVHIRVHVRIRIVPQCSATSRERAGNLLLLLFGCTQLVQVRPTPRIPGTRDPRQNRDQGENASERARESIWAVKLGQKREGEPANWLEEGSRLRRTYQIILGWGLSA